VGILKKLLNKFFKLIHFVPKKEVRELDHNKEDVILINPSIGLSTIEERDIIDNSFLTKSSNDPCY